MGLNATQTWYLRAGGAETNGGGFDPGISGAGTNYANQDSPKLSLSDLATSAANSTTLTSATGGFTAAMIGNVIRIASGTNFTTGYYAVTGYTNSNTVSLDRTPTPSAAGSAGVGKLGGAHPHILVYANGGAGQQPILTTPLSAGHTIYAVGAGGTPDFDWSSNYWSFPSGNSTSGSIALIGIGTQPLIYTMGLTIYGPTVWVLENISVKMTAGGFTNYGFIQGNTLVIMNCCFDQNGYDANLLSGAGNVVDGCELKNSGSKTAGSLPPVATAQWLTIQNCYIHDIRGIGVECLADNDGVVRNNIIANCGSHGIELICGGSGNNGQGIIDSNTIDNCGGDGINLNSLGCLQAAIKNNILSNNAGYGINSPNGTATTNDLFIRGRFAYNNFYGNTSGARNNVNAGPDDQAVNPAYVNASGGNYAITGSI